MAIDAGVSSDPLDVPGALAAVSGAVAGATAAFVGTVRETPAAPGAGGGKVLRLEYDAHPTLAGEKLREIATAAGERWGLEHVVALHRTGACTVGEPTVVVACSAAHRGPALDACRWMIDSIKHEVPIWKREVYATGASWIGAEAPA